MQIYSETVSENTQTWPEVGAEESKKSEILRVLEEAEKIKANFNNQEISDEYEELRTATVTALWELRKTTGNNIKDLQKEIWASSETDIDTEITEKELDLYTR